MSQRLVRRFVLTSSCQRVHCLVDAHRPIYLRFVPTRVISLRSFSLVYAHVLSASAASGCVGGCSPITCLNCAVSAVVCGLEFSGEWSKRDRQDSSAGVPVGPRGLHGDLWTGARMVIVARAFGVHFPSLHMFPRVSLCTMRPKRSLLQFALPFPSESTKLLNHSALRIPCNWAFVLSLHPYTRATCGMVEEYWFVCLFVCLFVLLLHSTRNISFGYSSTLLLQYT